MHQVSTKATEVPQYYPLHVFTYIVTALLMMMMHVSSYKGTE